jgi:hypothetical protein
MCSMALMTACGDGNQPGSAADIAYLTPLGLVGFGITTVLPGGTPVPTEATLSLSSLGGTWRDSAGNSGTFVFNGALPGATPRPIPSGNISPASVTNIHIANNAVTTANIVDASITSVDILDAPRAQFAGGGQFRPLTSTAAWSVALPSLPLVCEEAFGDTAVGDSEVTAIFVGGV